MMQLMEKSLSEFSTVLDILQYRARAMNLTGTEWAARAGVRKETLSRLNGRSSCDFATLQGLARVVGARVSVIDEEAPEATSDGRFPAHLSRQYEEKLVDLCASREFAPHLWRHYGPAFFMAGIAVMIASVPEFDRRSLLDLAEGLHAGSSQVGVFEMWLEGSPVRPARFLPMLLAGLRRAA
jgi:hypothetical protein